MRKLLSNILIFMMMIIAALPVMASETDIKEGHFMPLSQKFLEWQQSIQTEQEDTTETSLPKNTNSTGSTKLKTGYIPIPVDLSYLADNPPREPASAIKKTKDTTIPSTYDLRNVNGKSYVTSMKNQLPFGTCWAFAAIGAMESNYLKNIGGTLDLSEQHLSWFAFRNPDKSKAFDNLYGSRWTYEEIMENGGNAFYPTALYTRLAGPVNETDLPYETDMSTPTNITKEPEDYTRVLRLRDVFYLAHTESNVNSSTEARNNIKKRIMENGSVMASYFSHDSSYNKTASDGTAYYHKSSSINHAIQIIGWNDNYSRDYFKSKPSIDGAWLIKNSWGTRYGDEGYFWMSYEQHLEDGTAFVVEQVDPSMLAYCYDDLGWCSSWGWNTSQVYSANVFQALRNGEKLSEIGFYVPDNNLDYEITIYTGLSSMPSSNPTSGGTKAATIKGTMSYAGYHTVALDNPITLTKGQYFAVVLKFDGTGMTAVERRIKDFSDNAVIENGSFFSYNGTSWETGQTNGINACIKAFTTTGEGGIAPIILTSSLADGATGQSYSVEIAASGKRPLTWSLSSGKLPEGLSFSGGTISGIPTEAGDFTFTITARNSIGSDSQTYTLTINELPVFAVTSITGYVGYDLSKTGGRLKLSKDVSATWKANGTLPKSLKLNASTGVITGKVSKAGTYTVSFTASISTGDNITSNVTFNINEKPTKPKISTSKLPEGALETAYTKTAITTTGTAPITLTVSGLPAGLSFDGTAISGTPEKSGQFDVIITANNIATELEGKGGVTKKIKFTVKDQTPVIDPSVSFDEAIVGVKYEDVQLEITSGTNVKWTASGLPKGMTLSEKGLLSGTPQGNAKTYNVTLKVTNTGGKDQKKVTLNVLAKPELTTKKLSAATDGKKYTGKIAAKGSTPMSWDITGLPDGLSYSLVKNGASIAFSGQPEGMGKYPLTITMTNSAGTITNTSLTLEVKGVAPKITANVPKTGEANKSFTGNITVTGSTPLTITASENLKELGLTFSADSSTGIATITGTPTKSVKSLPVTITAKNDASAKPVTKKISLTINGTAASFAAPSTISNVTQAVKAGSQIQAIDFAVEGTPDFKFTMSHAEGFTLTQTGTYTARLTGTAPAKSGKTRITITAKNANGKAKKKIVIETTAVENQNAKPEVADEFTLPKAETYAQEAPEHEAQQEYAPAMTFGTDRTVESLGAGVRDMLEAEGYIIAAILPEVTVTESGMYDLDVTLQNGIRAGGVLHWFAFPQNAEPSEDDEIAEFYDEDGAEIDSVPPEGDITVSAWLNENVTYAPVIAVKYE